MGGSKFSGRWVRVDSKAHLLEVIVSMSKVRNMLCLFVSLAVTLRRPAVAVCLVFHDGTCLGPMPLSHTPPIPTTWRGTKRHDRIVDSCL